MKIGDIDDAIVKLLLDDGFDPNHPMAYIAKLSGRIILLNMEIEQWQELSLSWQREAIQRWKDRERK